MSKLLASGVYRATRESIRILKMKTLTKQSAFARNETHVFLTIDRVSGRLIASQKIVERRRFR